MAMTYDPIFAADPNNPSVVASNAAILIYDPADTGKAPLAITDSSGSPLANPITVNKNGFGPAFQHPTIDRVAWQGGGFEGFFTSYEGMKNAALDAAAAAQSAAATAGADAADAVADTLGATATAATTAATNATSAATAAANSAAAAAASANLVGAPADAAIAAAVNGAGATKTALNAAYALKGEAGKSLTAAAPMRAYGAKSAAVLAGTTTQLKWLTWGDSMAQGIFERMFEILRRQFGGNRSGVYFTGSSMSVTTNATTGTVTDATTAYDAWPTGFVSSFATGATRTYGVGGVAFASDKIKVYYVKETGAGTFKLQIDGVDAAGFENVSAVGTLGTLGIATLTPTLGAHTVKVVNLTGTVRIIGVGFENTTLPGIIPINVSKGGLELPDAMGASTARSNLQAFVADVNPTVITHEMKENDSYYLERLTQEMDIFTTGAPDADVVLIATQEIGGEAYTGIAEQNAILRTVANTYGATVFDADKAFGTYAEALAAGLYTVGDNVHYNTAGKDFLAGLFMRDLNLLGRAGLAKTAVQATVIEEELSMGNSPAQRVIRWIADIATALDVTARLQRVLNWSDSAGTVFASFDARNGSGQPSSIPKYSQVGPGMAGLVGTSASLLEARRTNAGNMNSRADFYARSFIPQSASISASTGAGAVVLDLSLGSTFIVTLDANITSLTFSNAVTSGQLVYVHFIQDATGGRTLGGVNNLFRFAGGVPTLTATASKTDSFTLQSGAGGVLTELSRALNK